MRYPFRSEGDAFRLVLLTVVGFAATALAALLGGPWAGVPVWAVVTVAALWLYALGERSGRGVRTAPPRTGGPGERRILVLADEPVPDERLLRELERTDGRTPRLLVVAPPRVSTLHMLTSDVDGARAAARERLDASVERLRARGLEARGDIGDEDPLLAIDDALRTFGADEIVIPTRPGSPLADAVRERFALPVTTIEA